jgi:hypothetical protein
MGLHIYLYLHAQLCADLEADVTRMARDERYRTNIEREIEQKAGLPLSFADVTDVPPQTAVEFDQASVDWDEIREYARVAVDMLSKFGDPSRLAANARALIDETIEEIRRAEITRAQPKPAAARGKTIGLCMIVKSETKLIRRCLESVLPLVDYIFVVDTGSTDGKQQIIRDFLAEKKVDGIVIEEPWRASPICLDASIHMYPAACDSGRRATFRAQES